MELIGTCETFGFTVEAYFPEHGKEDLWTLWVVKDGRVVHEVGLRMDVESPYGIDAYLLARLDAAADTTVRAVLRRDARAAGLPIAA